MRISLCAALVSTLIAGPVSAGTFIDLALPGSQLTSLSHNGRIAAGIYGDAGAWRWNKDSGAVTMTGFFSTSGMSSWGQPVAGMYSAGNDPADAVAALYYSNSDLLGGPDIIGGYPGTAGGFGQGVSAAYGVSDNGIAVGLAYDETNNPIAFRWTAAEGMTRLPVNRPDTFSRANGISRDGSVIYGWNDQEDGFRSAVVWIDGQPVDLTDADGNPIGEAQAASSDGSVVVGSSYNTINGSEAWRWTAATGAQPIGVLSAAPGAIGSAKRAKPRAPIVASERADARTGSGIDGFFAQAFAFAVSDDGNVVVGASGTFPFRSPTIWTPATGMQYLADYAAAHGVPIPAGWTPNTALALSADGLSIGGWGIDADSSLNSFIVDFHSSRSTVARVEAHGTVGFNDLPSGPFAGVPEGTPVTMTFGVSPNGFEIAPGQDTAYPIQLSTFRLRAGTAVDTLASTGDGPTVSITNDFPKSDGIHLFSTPTASGQAFEFELFNPGGDMFDSDDVNRIGRTFGPEFFEKISWIVSQGDQMMWIDLDSVRISDMPAGVRLR
jgi:uncharacterized membrane protein